MIIAKGIVAEEFDMASPRRMLPPSNHHDSDSDDSVGVVTLAHIHQAYGGITESEASGNVDFNASSNEPGLVVDDDEDNSDATEVEDDVMATAFSSAWDLLLLMRCYFPFHFMFHSIFGAFYVVRSMLLGHIVQFFFGEECQFPTFVPRWLKGNAVWSYLSVTMPLLLHGGKSFDEASAYGHKTATILSDPRAWPPPALVFLAILTLVALIVHPDGYTWVLLRKLRQGIMSILRSSSSLCWTLFLDDHSTFLSSALALMTFAALFFFIFILHKTLAPRQSQSEKSRLQQQQQQCPSTSSDKHRKKKRRHHHGRNHRSGRSKGCSQHRAKGDETGRVQSQESLNDVSQNVQNEKDVKDLGSSRQLPALLEDKPVDGPLLESGSVLSKDNLEKHDRHEDYDTSSTASRDRTCSSSTLDTSALSDDLSCGGSVVSDRSASTAASISVPSLTSVTVTQQLAPTSSHQSFQPRNVSISSVVEENAAPSPVAETPKKPVSNSHQPLRDRQVPKTVSTNRSQQRPVAHPSSSKSNVTTVNEMCSVSTAGPQVQKNRIGKAASCSPSAVDGKGRSKGKNPNQGVGRNNSGRRQHNRRSRKTGRNNDMSSDSPNHGPVQPPHYPRTESYSSAKKRTESVSRIVGASRWDVLKPKSTPNHRFPSQRVPSGTRSPHATQMSKGRVSPAQSPRSHSGTPLGIKDSFEVEDKRIVPPASPAAQSLMSCEIGASDWNHASLAAPFTDKARGSPLRAFSDSLHQPTFYPPKPEAKPASSSSHFGEDSFFTSLNARSSPSSWVQENAVQKTKTSPRPPPGLAPLNGNNVFSGTFQPSKDMKGRMTCSLPAPSLVQASFLSGYGGLSLPPGSSPPFRPQETPVFSVKENPFAPDDDQIEADLQELGGQMIGSILD